MSFLRSQQANKKKTGSPRWFIGISVAANCRRIEAAMIGVHGQGSGAPIEIRRTISFDIPREIIDSYNELQDAVFEACPGSRFAPQADGNVRVPFPLLQHVLRELASVEEEAIEELVLESQLMPGDITAVGVHDPGLRCATPSGLYYQSLCDAPYLADLTGMNVIDAFPARDIAAQGRGGPVLALPSWIYLKSESRDRILLDLGRTARLTFLPKAENPFSHQKIRYRDIVPCGSLLDALTWEMTGGETSVDIGGRLTVQGCQVPSLLAEFRMHAETPHDWCPLGLPVEAYLRTAARSRKNGQSHQDVLCTACMFIAETIVEQIRKMVADQSTELETAPEILLTGTARLHGMLFGRIGSALKPMTVSPISQFGVPPETFDALCTAMLCLMHVDHIPAGLPHLSGSETSQTLGRLTPGSIGAWTRLLREMAETKPSGRSLRAAM